MVRSCELWRPFLHKHIMIIQVYTLQSESYHCSILLWMNVDNNWLGMNTVWAISNWNCNKPFIAYIGQTASSLFVIGSGEKRTSLMTKGKSGPATRDYGIASASLLVKDMMQIECARYTTFPHLIPRKNFNTNALTGNKTN